MRLFTLTCFLYFKMLYTKMYISERIRPVAQMENNKYCECGRRNDFESSDSRVIGGEETMRNEFPWMAALIKINSLQLICGGTIINDRYVLTAAHCVISQKNKTKVIVGVHNLCKSDSNSAIFSIEKFIRHPAFDRTRNYADIMLVKLYKGITFNKYVKPICLPKIGTDVDAEFGGNMLTVLGWGYADTSYEVCGLRATNVTLYKSIHCPTNVPTLLCAGYKKAPRGTCKGDSGGPLQLLNRNEKFILLGIVSSGIGCGDVNYPDSYTNVAIMIPWIMEITMSDSTYCWR